ncbi:LysR family transcriptional regulator [Nocardia gamkensis]|uniref:LysR family transcriptional regulator n=1 Tax=Nocardia gamkensis TaxID=352869 RepID=UPI0036EACB38
MSWATLARWARYHIPLRRHGATLARKTTCTAAELADAPALLQPARAQIDGLGRLNDFATTSRHRTLSSAVADLGTNATVLRNRIQELEYDLGGVLLNRAHARRPMTLTPIGQAVLDAIQTWLQPHR